MKQTPRPSRPTSQRRRLLIGALRRPEEELCNRACLNAGRGPGAILACSSFAHLSVEKGPLLSVHGHGGKFAVLCSHHRLLRARRNVHSRANVATGLTADTSGLLQNLRARQCSVNPGIDRCVPNGSTVCFQQSCFLASATRILACTFGTRRLRNFRQFKALERRHP